MPNWINGDGGVALRESAELQAGRLTNELLREAVADLESLYRDDVGWQRIGQSTGQFTPEGRRNIASLADLMATGNALIKRGLNLRAAYIWGQGVTATIQDDGAEGQDVNAVWAEFWDEKSNRSELTASEAQVRLERKLGTAGEAFYAFPTDPLTGRVKVRHIPSVEIVDRITDPEDAAAIWLYKREWSVITYSSDGVKGAEPRTEYYPALGYWPAVRSKIWYDGNPIRWDAPIRHIAVNVMDEDWRGLGDCFPAMPWAKLDKEFLEDLGLYMRAMTRILAQVTTKAGKATAAAATVARGVTTAPNGNPNGVASIVGMDPNSSFSLVSKSGAHIDSDSHRPLATMVAAALEVPLTMLLGDPGSTGARAVAETLDQPTELTMRLRQKVHEEFLRDVADYVVDMAVVAPRGPLTGAVTRDGDRLLVTLPDTDQRTLEVDWPEFSSTPIDTLIKAIAAADQTEAFPQLLVFQLLARALEVEDIDDWVEKLTDDDGNWVGLEAVQAAAQARQDDRGEGPPIPPADDEEPDDDEEDEPEQ